MAKADETMETLHWYFEYILNFIYWEFYYVSALD